jgi:quercetin 2,3-dioxygenase
LGALPIRTSARVLGATLKAGQQAEYRLSGRHAYLVPAAGKVEVNGITAGAGDGLAIQDERVLHVTAIDDAELVLVDAA